MTVEGKLTEEIIKKKNVLVGIRMDGNDRFLLHWVLVRVAEPGDHVVALHVCRDVMTDEHHSLLDEYLQVYKGLCNARQLDLIGKVSGGKSIKKVLVREAKLCEAMIVVVGISSQTSLCGWVSVGNYCAKKLPPTTTVLTVHNGKVVFQRGFTNQLPGIKGDWARSLYPIQPESSKENNSCSVASEAPMPDTAETQLVQNTVDGSRDGGNALKPDTFHGNINKDETSSSSISSGGNTKQENSSRLHEDREEISSNSVDKLIKEIAEPTPGWPLLKRSATQGIAKGLGARKMSVVQWAMSLPKRAYPSIPQNENDFVSDQTQVLEKEIIGMSPRSTKNSLFAWGDLPKEIIGMSPRSTKNSLSAWGDLPKELELLLRTNSSRCKWFSHKELMDATFQFSSDNLIAEGGYSSVYKGCLLDGKALAVKIVKMSKEAWNDYILEVDIISSLKHKHIIPLIGVSMDDNDLILVYDYFSKGSLEETLHGKKDKCALSWERRFNVAIGVAEAINYLHKECSRPVIHRDIKSSNILLSDEFEPQISDFGLAIWAPTSSSDTHSDVVGTFGYLAPEYFMYGKISEKIDVYSYGVVLLELLSGKKPITTSTLKGQESLVMWAKPLLDSGNVTSILDPDLSEKIDEVQIQRMIMAINLCITRTARLRPEMDQILKLLQGEKNLEEWMNSHLKDQEELDNHDDDEVYPDSSAESHLGVALLDMDDDTTSFGSVDQHIHHTFEDYLKGRCSRSSSFD